MRACRIPLLAGCCCALLLPALAAHAQGKDSFFNSDDLRPVKFNYDSSAGAAYFARIHAGQEADYPAIAKQFADGGQKNRAEMEFVQNYLAQNGINSKVAKTDVAGLKSHTGPYILCMRIKSVEGPILIFGFYDSAKSKFVTVDYKFRDRLIATEKFLLDTVWEGEALLLDPPAGK